MFFFLVVFCLYIYNGLANLTRSFTRFNSINKTRIRVKIPSCCPRWLVETQWQDCKNPRSKQFFYCNNNDNMQALQDTTLRKIVQTHIRTSSRRKNILVLWNFAVQYKSTRHNNQRLQEQTCTMLDVTVAADKSISVKEFSKLPKCRDLEIGMTKMWKLGNKDSSSGNRLQ